MTSDRSRTVYCDGTALGEGWVSIGRLQVTARAVNDLGEVVLEHQVEVETALAGDASPLVCAQLLQLYLLQLRDAVNAEARRQARATQHIREVPR